MPHPSPLAVYNLLSTLVTAAGDELEGTEAGRPDRTCVYNGGQVAADDCCDGQLYGRWERSYLTRNFPVPTIDAIRCVNGTMLGVDLAVGILRCAPTLDDNGEPPSCEAIDESAQLLHFDASTVAYAVACTLELNGVEWVFRSQGPLSTEGGCVGSEFQFTVQAEACLCR
jgi:hypothetical protein